MLMVACNQTVGIWLRVMRVGHSCFPKDGGTRSGMKVGVGGRRQRRGRSFAVSDESDAGMAPSFRAWRCCTINLWVAPLFMVSPSWVL